MLPGSLLLDLLFPEGVWNIGHPLGLVLAKELALGRHLFRLVEGSPHDVPELVCCLFSIFADICATVITELPCHSIVLLEQLWGPGLVPEALEGDLCGETIVGPECPLAAVAMTERGSGIMERVKL